MKCIIINIIIFLTFSCKTGLITDELKKGNYMFEKQNYKWEEENKEFKGKGKYDGVYYFNDGSEVDYSYNDVNILAPKPLFYVEYKEFYNNGFIKQKGKFFGKFQVNSFSTKIGIWYEFDERGNLIKQTDEDVKFGDFSYNEVLSFLDKKKEISLHTGKNRENLEIDFYFSSSSSKKLWEARIKIGKSYGVANLPDDKGERYEQKIKIYYLDGNTGEIVQRKDLVNYKSIITGFDKIYPDLK